MAEQISKQTYQILKRVPHPVLKFLKTHYRHVRFRKALREGQEAFKRYGHLYPNRILFIAGLPKSGTSWLESMLTAFPGYTIIPDPEITLWDYRHGGTHRFEMSISYFQQIQNALSLVKVHCHGSSRNLDLLKNLGIPYVIIYRDLRDAAVSHVFYVKRTKWHPEYPAYEKLDIQSGLRHFANTLLPQWKEWITGWKTSRDKTNSLVVRYEDLRRDTANVFQSVVNLYGLPNGNVDEIVASHHFSEMKKKGDFFRKGEAGDWKNHFEGEIKDVFKKEIGRFLIQEGYEQDLNW